MTSLRGCVFRCERPFRGAVQLPDPGDEGARRQDSLDARDGQVPAAATVVAPQPHLLRRLPVLLPQPRVDQLHTQNGQSCHSRMWFCF